MIYYKCKADLVCGAKGTLYTLSEMKKYQLEPKSANFERVNIPEYKTEVWCGIRKENGNE